MVDKSQLIFTGFFDLILPIQFAIINKYGCFWIEIEGILYFIYLTELSFGQTGFQQ
ncbi:hypothetical protein CLOSTMETH_02270 [[Clostridium] methylpentosum DSM 5476]|uniref:Uncharacterized protein n=1 Tax=[Clostridium] methylpentosum DSM 5476 TaxID=537013 RepID=C0EEI4_9FIRM|nr:hypothetical protein CLOSTMETH_02270 [[Clostridium] methylpentosum DSM 5476]